MHAYATEFRDRLSSTSGNGRVPYCATAVMKPLFRAGTVKGGQKNARIPNTMLVASTPLPSARE